MNDTQNSVDSLEHCRDFFAWAHKTLSQMKNDLGDDYELTVHSENGTLYSTASSVPFSVSVPYKKESNDDHDLLQCKDRLWIVLDYLGQVDEALLWCRQGPQKSGDGTSVSCVLELVKATAGR